MGRTSPTYRRWLQHLREEWQPYRRALRQRYRGDFDRLFDHAEHHADAAGSMNATAPMDAVLVSILLAQERERRELEARVEALEDGD